MYFYIWIREGQNLMRFDSRRRSEFVRDKNERGPYQVASHFFPICYLLIENITFRFSSARLAIARQDSKATTEALPEAKINMYIVQPIVAPP